MVKNEIEDEVRVDERDYLPLKQRFKLLLASMLDESAREPTQLQISPPSNVVVKREEDVDALEGVLLSDTGVQKAGEKKGKILLEQSCIYRIPDNDAAAPMNENQIDSGMVQLKSQIASCHNVPGDSKGQEAQENNAVCSTYITDPEVTVVAGLEKMETNTHYLSQHPSLSTFPVKKEFENTENLVSPYREDIHVSCLAVDRACHVKNKSRGEIGADALDHIPLIKRRKMLLLTHCSSMSQSMETSRDKHKEGLMKGFFTSDTDFCNFGEMKEEIISFEPCSAVRITETQGDSGTFQVRSEVSTSCYGALPRYCSGEESYENSVICSSQITNPEAKDDSGQGTIDDTDGHNVSHHPTPSMLPMKVKVEHSEVLVSPYEEAGHAVAEACDVKNECHSGIGTDALDHIALQERHRILLLTQSFSMRQLMATSREVYRDGVMESVFTSNTDSYGAGEGKKEAVLHEQRFSNRITENVPVVPMSKNLVDSGTLQLHSEVASMCHQATLPGYCNGGQTQLNNIICSSQISNPELRDDAGQGKLDANGHITSQHPVLSKVKVEHTDLLVGHCRDVLVPLGHEADASNVNYGSLDEMRTDMLDHIPLQERRRMLLLTHSSSTRQSMETPRKMDIAGLREGVFTSNTNHCIVGEGRKETVLHEPSFADRITENVAVVPMKENKVDSGTVQLFGAQPGYCHGEETGANNFVCSNQINNLRVMGDAAQRKLDTNGHHVSQHPTLSMLPSKVKVEYSEGLVSPCRDDRNASGHVIGEACNIHSGSRDEIGSDVLDHIPLQERRRMLLLTHNSSTRQSMETSTEMHVAELVEVASLSQSAEFDYSMARSSSHILPKLSACKLLRSTNSGSSSSNVAGSFGLIPVCLSKVTDVQDTFSPTLTDTCEGQFNGNRDCIQDHSFVWQESVSANADNVVGSAMPTFLLKEEIKTEENGLERPCENAFPILSNINNVMAVKTELKISAESCDNDEVDHMSLHQRKKLLIVRNALSLDIPRNLKCLRKTPPSAIGCNPTTTKPEGINCRRKRKKTATDSAVTALEEDAPGLLQVLIDKGILTDEIKLYGNEETEDPLDISWEEESFLDLENVVSKLFPPASSFLKFPLQRCTKGSKPSYCLACLLSLVEQARYLQFRKWPVEWGWCRDLKSFIFIFERHNRIVLERPEYGFATYFFEMVHSLPTSWQIKRLVTAMKLTNCSRANLIENKSLLVGEDLSEGEAKVLEDYGWTPNTGLGSMLNYCDRVFHDRKNEKEISEWRSKIGKILMDGHDGGRLVLANLPKKLEGYNHTPNSEVKFAKFDMKPASSAGETCISDY